MTRLSDVLIVGGGPRHIWDSTTGLTLCGIDSFASNLGRQEREQYDLCGNCSRTHARMMVDRVEPEIEAGRTARGGELAAAGALREVTGRIFRVAGSSGAYTVVIPDDVDLASICTCYDGKTKPELLCKHQSAVYLEIGVEA